MHKVLLTGGLGFIGSHTAVELMEAGFDVVILDNLSNSSIEVLDGIEKISGKRPVFIQQDLEDYDSCFEALQQHKDLSGVIHFAASKAVGESVEFPIKYYNNNIGGLLNLLKLCREYSMFNFIFSSSCTVYGIPDVLPVTESTPTKKANSPYGATKQMAETILEDYSNATKDFHCIALRYFNPIGSHESAEIGELPLGVPANLMPFITQTAAGVRPKLKVFGNDYQTKDGTAIRDYIHVVDLAKAHVQALKKLQEEVLQTRYNFYNIGTGKGCSVMEVIDSFERTSGVTLAYEVTARRKGDVPAIFADTTLAKEVLDWEAQYDLDDMTRSAWNWQRKISNL